MNTLADAVKVTLGPKGSQRRPREEVGAPTITNDGVSIARRSRRGPVRERSGPARQGGRQRTDDIAGDGTDGHRAGWRSSREGAAQRGRRNQPDGPQAWDQKRPSRPVSDQLLAMARTSTADEIAATASIGRHFKIGEIIAEAMVMQVGKEGVITVEGEAPGGLVGTRLTVAPSGRGPSRSGTVTDRKGHAIGTSPARSATGTSPPSHQS